MARKTIAQALREEGWLEGYREGALDALRRTLQRQLVLAFGSVPKATRKTIQITQDIAQLEEWLLRFAVAESLDEIGV